VAGRCHRVGAWPLQDIRLLNQGLFTTQYYSWHYRHLRYCPSFYVAIDVGQSMVSPRAPCFAIQHTILVLLFNHQYRIKAKWGRALAECGMARGRECVWRESAIGVWTKGVVGALAVQQQVSRRWCRLLWNSHRAGGDAVVDTRRRDAHICKSIRWYYGTGQLTAVSTCGCGCGAAGSLDSHSRYMTVCGRNYPAGATTRTTDGV